MYIVKMTKKGVRTEVAIMEKVWSEQMLSHSIIEIARADFMLKSSARRWADKQILNAIDERYGLEYING